MKSIRVAGVVMAFMLMLTSVGAEPTLAATAGGQVVVSHRKEGNFDYVVGRVRVQAPPDQVWMVMANPYEFEQKISTKCHVEKVQSDTPQVSVITARVDVGFLLPPVHYTVESRYENRRKITFHALSGDLRDFRGSWEVTPTEDGGGSYVTFGMFVQPNLPIPQWLVRHTIRAELPHTLTALRTRIEQLSAREDKPVTRKLASTGEVRFD